MSLYTPQDHLDDMRRQAAITMVVRKWKRCPHREIRRNFVCAECGLTLRTITIIKHTEEECRDTILREAAAHYLRDQR
jgi:hypothetical protein